MANRKMLMRIPRQRVADVVLDQLLQLLEGDHFKPGDQLPTEKDLMEQMGVSRPPVREALNALVGMGLVDKRHGSGYYVKAVELTSFFASKSIGFLDTEHQADDLVEARLMLEGEIFVKLAGQVDDGTLRALRDRLDEMASIADEGEYTIEHSAEFHTLLARLTGNTILPHLVEFLHRLSVKSAHMDRFDPEVELAVHRQLVDALEHGLHPETRQIMHDHILASHCRGHSPDHEDVAQPEDTHTGT